MNSEECTVFDCIEKLGYKSINKSYQEQIIDMLDWYKGDVDKFHKYSVYNGVTKVTKERKKLGMAKTICEDWANLLLNEKVKISVEKDSQEILESVLLENRFDVRANQLIELTFALGTGAFVEYLNNGEVVIDYIRADMIYPISWDNGKITECIFASKSKENEKEVIYLQVHVKEENSYHIKNHIFDAKSGAKLINDSITEEVDTNRNVPCFQIVMPNIVNNKDLGSPMGISIYANAIDEIKGCDLIYDSYINEFDIGKKRILVPMSFAKIMQAGEGKGRPVFDNNDTTFYAYEGKTENSLIKEIDMNLRADDHDKGLQKALDLLSFKCGLGSGRYRFENGVVKTAKEVVSNQSALYQGIKKHEIVLRDVLICLIKSIFELKNISYKEDDITIQFDDSLFSDSESERKNDREDVALGVMPHWEYRAKWYGEDEKTAKKNIPEQADVIME